MRYDSKPQLPQNATTFLFLFIALSRKPVDLNHFGGVQNADLTEEDIHGDTLNGSKTVGSHELSFALWKDLRPLNPNSNPFPLRLLKTTPILSPRVCLHCAVSDQLGAG